MRSIATLGMIFLPATFVSSFFSMDFFQWSGEEGKSQELISSYFWVYVVVAIGLTVLTMSIFYTCVLRAPSVEVDEESTCS
jgi:Mg2+ and Co2+ transporter CorA